MSFVTGLGALRERFVQAAKGADIPLEVLHRVVSMASGGMDMLTYRCAVITLLGVTGLTYRQPSSDIFAITCVKALAVFFVIGADDATGIV